MCPRIFNKSFAPVRPDVFAGLALFGLTFLVYLRTLAPGVYGFDSAELATGVFSQGIVHPPGYPLYLLIGKLFTLIPLGDIAYRLNLMSAFFGALTVAILFHVITLVSGNRGIAWISAAIFGFSNYFWQMALVAEVYTLHTALLAVNLVLVLYWAKTGKKPALFLFAFVYGLSLTNHVSSILFAPGFAWIIARNQWWNWKKWNYVLGMLLLFLLGLAPYLYLPLRAQANPLLNYVSTYYNIDIASPAGLFWMMTGQAYRFFSFGYTLPELPGEIANFASFLWRNFLGVGVLLGLVGAVRLYKRNINIFIGISIAFLATVVYYVNYRVTDKDTMFLAAYLIWAIFLSEGLLLVEKWLREKVLIGLTNRFRSAGLILLSVVFISEPFLNWHWVDMSNSDSLSKYAQTVLSEVEPNALVIAPWSQAVVLEYYQIVYGQRPDIKIINSSRLNAANYYKLWAQGYKPEEIFRVISQKNVALISNFINSRSVYSLDYDPTLAEQYEYLPDGGFFRLSAK